MELIPIFLKEFIREAKTTRAMLERVPDDKWDWKPHPKSMSMRQLTTHLAELPTWVPIALTTPELDFATTPYNPPHIESKKDLLDFFDRSLEVGQSNLLPGYEDRLTENWYLKNNGEVLDTMTREEVLRMVLNQITHHRAQLGVYLRLLDIPIPGSYGPSADEQ